MEMSNRAANELRRRVEELVREWFEDHGGDRAKLTRINYEIRVSYDDAPMRVVSGEHGSRAQIVD